MGGNQKKVCCVRACPARNAEGLNYFSLPVDIDRRLKWLKVIGRPDMNREGLEPRNYTVCSIHFDSNQIGVLKQLLPDTVPTKNIPRKWKGVFVSCSTTASQTDFSCNEDDDDYDRDFQSKKRRLDKDEKVIVYKSVKPNRKLFLYCEIDYNDKEINDDAVDDTPEYSLNYSRNLPRDSIALGNRKMHVFHEDENVAKRDNVSKLDEQFPKAQLPKVSLPKVAIPKWGIPSSNKVISPCVPIPNWNVPSSNKVISPHVPIPNWNVPSNNEVILPNVQIPNKSVLGNDEVKTPDIVISNVFSLSNAADNPTMNKFFEWMDRTKNRFRGGKFDKDFKMFALNLHTINTRAYRLLMHVWKLPKEKELKEIKLKIAPRFDNQMTRLLTQKLKTLSKEAMFCTLGLQSMTLKPHFYYDIDNDEIIGVHNVNGNTCRMSANHALVAMVRGIKVPWHQPVAFSLLSTMDDFEIINVFIANIILKLKKMGLKILGLVMDEPFFWRYCRSKNFVSITKNYIVIDKEMFNVVIDIPHVLNMFKDDFVKHDFILENKTVSWKYVKAVYDLDEERGGRLLSKLTESIKYPCQVFSRTVSAAMQFYMDHGLLDKEAAPTADFIKKLNDALEVMNITKLNKLPNKRNTDAQSNLRARAQLKAIDDANSIFKKLRVVNKSKGTIDLDSLKYLLISLKSLTSMFLALKDTYNQNGFAQTSFCYLEPMQEFMKSVQEHAKTNRPKSFQFTRVFSKLFLENLVDLTPPPKSIDDMENFLNMADGVKDCNEAYEGSKVFLGDTDYRFLLPKEYSIIYVASYIIYKCSEMHLCKVFREYIKDLVDLNKTKMYINFVGYNKDAAFYNKLKLPAFEFVSYVEKLDERFMKAFIDFYHSNPAGRIFGALFFVPQTGLPCTCFPTDYMLKLFARTRLFQTMLHNTKCLKGRSPCDPPYVLEVKRL